MALLDIAAAFGGKLLDMGAAKDQSQLQEKFAKNAIQWKVKDAQAAGIHPLYALGANTVSYSPVSVGSTWQDTLSGMGADLSRAASAVSTAGTRGADDAIGRLALERAGLENDLLRAQIASVGSRLAAPHVGPAMPSVNTPAGNWMVSPFTPAQEAENQYGEVGGELVGILNLDRDLQKTMFKPDSPVIHVVRKPGGLFGTPAKPGYVGRSPYRR